MVGSSTGEQNWWAAALVGSSTGGQQHYSSRGVLDYWTAGLLDYWTTGLLDHWPTTGLLDCISLFPKMFICSRCIYGLRRSGKVLVHACISKLVMHVLIASQNCSLRRSAATKVVCASCNSVLRICKRDLGIRAMGISTRIKQAGCLQVSLQYLAVGVSQKVVVSHSKYEGS